MAICAHRLSIGKQYRWRGRGQWGRPKWSFWEQDMPLLVGGGSSKIEHFCENEMLSVNKPSQPTTAWTKQSLKASEATSSPCFIICGHCCYDNFSEALLGTKKIPTGTNFVYRTWKSWSVWWRLNGQDSSQALLRNPPSPILKTVWNIHLYCHKST